MKILFQPDDLDSIEANMVAEAANRLGVGEFQFFQLAFRAWHGREIEPNRLEREFWNYMTNDEVPHWVRQFARGIIEADDAGILDRENPLYHRHDRFGPPASNVFRERMSAVLLLVILTTLFVYAFLKYQDTITDKFICNFPPCPVQSETDPISPPRR